MKLPKKIRTRLGQIKFAQEIHKLKIKHEIVAFENAASIGLVYDATNEVDYETIRAYVKTIRSQYKKDVLSMGFVDKKEMPPSQFAQYGMDFFTRRDLDFRMIPKNPLVDNFIEKKFDILINLHSGNCFPLRYICALSRARFRIGPYDKKNTMCYDMMIHRSGETSLKTIIQETEEFIRKIKS